jgi:hypothetical protein
MTSSAYRRSPPARISIGELSPRAESEDHVYVSSAGVVVLDGATSIARTVRSGGWYAGVLGARLATHLSADPRRGLADMLEAAIDEVRQAYDLRPGASPSSTVTMVRWSDVLVEGLVLGDSPIVVLTRDERIIVFEDRRLARVASDRHRAYREHLRAGGGFGERHRRLIGDLQAEERKVRNTEQGFWIAEAVPEAARRAAVARWPRHEVAAMLIATDGVASGPQHYGVPGDWRQAIELAAGSGPQELLRRIQDAEQSDRDGRCWPRPKCSDDKAAVLIEFGPRVPTSPV